ncbi:MAG: amino acid ABC transporter permease [Candidatus Babeliaceae bacterium]|jgi:polar amino acid transport system permease protein
MINMTIIIAALPSLLHGAAVSLCIASAALGIGFFVGVLLGIAQTSNSTLLKNFVMVYVTLIRGTPMLIHIVFLYYILSITGLSLSALSAAIIAIGLNSSAYVSQIIRSGINSVSRGQIEAAKTLGIKRIDLIRYIIMPQALRVVLPSLGNEAVTLIKDSSLASIIGVTELYQEGKIVISHTYDALSVYCALAVIYLIMTTTLSSLVNYYEKRLNNAQY